MKITFVCLSLSGGGTERIISNLANYFSKDNSVSIVKFLKCKDDYTLNSKIKTYEIDKSCYLKKNKIRKMLCKFSLFRLLKLNKIIKKEKPDVIFCFLPLPSFYMMFLKRINRKIKRIPVILSERGDPNVTFSKSYLYHLMKCLYKKADGFVFQTSDAKKYYNNIIKCKTKIIGNPLNEDFIKTDYSHNRKKEIVTVGRLEKQKNHFLLIDSFAIVHKKYNDYKLLIYGDGSMKNNIKEYIEKKDLNDCIILMGKSKKIYDDIYDSSVFVLSSDFEGLPNALLEALALGVPCISTDCPVGGPSMLIDNNENGLLVKVGDYKGLSNAIIKIITNNTLSDQYSSNAMKKVKKYYPQNINKEWEMFMYEVVNHI